MLVKQEYYMLMVPHEHTLWGALKWFLTRRNKHCHKFCPMCKWYYRCQEDVALEESLEEK